MSQNNFPNKYEILLLFSDLERFWLPEEEKMLQIFTKKCRHLEKFSDMFNKKIGYIWHQPIILVG